VAAWTTFPSFAILVSVPDCILPQRQERLTSSANFLRIHQQILEYSCSPKDRETNWNKKIYSARHSKFTRPRNWHIVVVCTWTKLDHMRRLQPKTISAFFASLTLTFDVNLEKKYRCDRNIWNQTISGVTRKNYFSILTFNFDLDSNTVGRQRDRRSTFWSIFEVNRTLCATDGQNHGTTDSLTCVGYKNSTQPRVITGQQIYNILDSSNKNN